MGLDNGIYIKNYKHKPFYVKEQLYKEKNHINLAYWRRYWGLRSDMIDIVCADYEGNDLKVLLSAKQIKEMRALIWKITFSKKKYLEACNDDWEYNKYSIFRGIRQIINLTWAARQVKKDPQVEVFWYDSY